MLGKTGVLINQYNLATSYFQSGYDGFLETLGMTQQTDSDGLHYSDMRRLRLDEVTMNVNGTIIHKHSLEYNESLIPRRWTYAIDEYGYPNGQTTNKNLVPKIKIDDAGLATSPQVDLTGLTVIDLANRDADDFYSKKLMLKKITYPTSGNTSLIYEGHSHYTTRIIESSVNAVDLKFDNCSSPQTTCPTCCLAQKKTTLPTALNFTNPLYRYEMMITAVKTADDNSNVPIDVLLRTRSLPFPNMQLFDDIVLDAGNGFSVQKCYQLTQGNYPISPPSPTNQYEFEVEVGNGRRVFVHFVIVQHTRTYQNLNQQIGGLRIKTITTHPVIGDAIVKNYAYENVNAPESSGYIIGRPAYLEDLPLSAGISYGLSSNPSCVAMGYKLNTGSIFPLTSVQGSHIGYSRVVERVSTDQGHTETRFYTDPIHNPKYLVTFPARPEVFADPRVGNMIEESHL
jgi:hypothetical protein